MYREDDQGALTPVEWAIRKYWDKKSDSELAKGLGTSVSVIQDMRKELGLERPKGTESMKEFARRYLLEMNDQEKKEFLEGLSSDTIWEMAEGKAAATGELTVHHDPQRIDISHQLFKVYGDDTTGIRESTAEVLSVSKASRKSVGSGK